MIYDKCDNQDDETFKTRVMAFELFNIGEPAYKSSNFYQFFTKLSKDEGDSQI